MTVGGRQPKSRGAGLMGKMTGSALGICIVPTIIMFFYSIRLLVCCRQSEKRPGLDPFSHFENVCEKGGLHANSPT